MPVEYIDTRVLNRQENLEALIALPEESVDLVYLDPPFFSNRFYEVIWGEEAEIRSFEDRWDGGIKTYSEWMALRLWQIQRVLKPTGSVYLHCDPHASHYLKVIMDDIFGSNNFRNEIVWKRTWAHGGSKRYAPVHDVILFYTKGNNFTWNPQTTAYSDDYIAKKFSNFEKDGRRYRATILTGSGTRGGESGKAWRGVDPTESGRHWAVPGYVRALLGPDGESLGVHAALDAMDELGRILWPVRAGGGAPSFKQYLNDLEGVALQDIWVDIPPIPARDRERLGYPTQKPEALLARIIRASSNKGDTVLDPFCGCGTTVSVAEKLEREWIGIDISPTAVNLMRDRLNKIGNVRPFKVMNMPETVQALRSLKPFEFQNWAVQQFYGTASLRKSGDMGIDGMTWDGNPLQVKRSDNVGRNVVDNFETAMRRGGFTKGYIVAFSFTSPARKEAARARWDDKVEIKLVKVADLLKPQAKDEFPELGQVRTLRAGWVKDARPSPEQLIESDKSALPA